MFHLYASVSPSGGRVFGIHGPETRPSRQPTRQGHLTLVDHLDQLVGALGLLTVLVLRGYDFTHARVVGSHLHAQTVERRAAVPAAELIGGPRGRELLAVDTRTVRSHGLYPLVKGLTVACL